LMRWTNFLHGIKFWNIWLTECPSDRGCPRGQNIGHQPDSRRRAQYRPWPHRVPSPPLRPTLTHGQTDVTTYFKLETASALSRMKSKSDRRTKETACLVKSGRRSNGRDRQPFSECR
jgi:hypothetical protein